SESRDCVHRDRRRLPQPVRRSWRRRLPLLGGGLGHPEPARTDPGIAGSRIEHWSAEQFTASAVRDETAVSGDDMPPNPMTPVSRTSLAHRATSRLLGIMSIFTMLMTVPQALTIWIGHQAAGVSLLSWSAY